MWGLIVCFRCLLARLLSLVDVEMLCWLNRIIRGAGGWGGDTMYCPLPGWCTLGYMLGYLSRIQLRDIRTYPMYYLEYE